MKNIFFVLLLGVGLISIYSCDEDCDDVNNPMCPNYDPCYWERATNADFTITQGVGYNEQRRYFSSDTFMTGFIRLQAVENLDSYEWHIGSDNRIFEGKTVELDYSPYTGWVDVMLIGKNAIKEGCLPGDDGVDTVQKSFYLVPYNTTLLTGKYKGVSLSQPLDTFEFDFDLNMSVNPFVFGPSEFPKGCFRPYGMDCAIRYRHFFMFDLGSTSFCPEPSGSGELSLDNVLTIIYDYSGDDDNNKTNTIKRDTFIGEKIQ